MIARFSCISLLCTSLPLSLSLSIHIYSYSKSLLTACICHCVMLVNRVSCIPWNYVPIAQVHNIMTSGFYQYKEIVGTVCVYMCVCVCVYMHGSVTMKIDTALTVSHQHCPWFELHWNLEAKQVNMSVRVGCMYSTCSQS